MPAGAASGAARVLAALAIAGGLSGAAVALARPTGGPAPTQTSPFAPEDPSVSAGATATPSSRPSVSAADPADPGEAGGRTVAVGTPDASPRADHRDVGRASAARARDARRSESAIPVATAPGDPPPSGDVPVRVRIPSIGVDSTLVDLGIAADGTMQVPADFDLAGWLTAAPAPGQRGPAVIAGHVDSHDGPAVFFRLGDLVPGDRVEVVQRDGDVLTFTVRSLARFAKDDFPTDLVYGPAPGPVLRLITCSGQVDPVSGHYLDNTVVFAS